MNKTHSLTQMLFQLTLILTSIQVVFLPMALAQRKSITNSILDLRQFLDEVRSRNQSFLASSKLIEAATRIGDESNLILSPQVFATAQHLDDQKPSSLYRYNSMFSSQYQLGLSQQTTIGLQAKLAYSLNLTDFQGSAVPRSWDTKPSLELSQSLLRNWAGSEVQAAQDLSNASSKASIFGESFKARTILFDAEVAYWRLALAREAVNLAKDSLVRAQKLSDWSQRRAQLGLADKSDALQSSANLQARRLELESAEDDLKVAARSFNRARGFDSEDVPERLSELTPTMIAQLDLPKSRPGIRDDVKAAEQVARATQASATLGEEKNTPTLEVFGAVTLNGSDEVASRSIDNGWKTDQRSALVGVRFSAPLDFQTSSSVREGYRINQTAAALTYERKRFESERDWSDLLGRFKDAKERVLLYEKLIEIQSEKYTHERTKQSAGRSTIAQVLMFELDLENAQFGKLRSLTELLNLNAQLKLYGVER